MNKVIVKGNLTRDPEVRVVETNGKKTSVVNLTVAVSRRFKKKDGEWAEDTCFLPCEAWDTGAEQIGERFKKGDPILFEGTLKEERWTQDDQNRSRLKVRLQRFERLPRWNQNGSKKEENEEEVPFA